MSCHGRVIETRIWHPSLVSKALPLHHHPVYCKEQSVQKSCPLTCPTDTQDIHRLESVKSRKRSNFCRHVTCEACGYEKCGRWEEEDSEPSADRYMHNFRFLKMGISVGVVRTQNSSLRLYCTWHSSNAWDLVLVYKAYIPLTLPSLFLLHWFCSVHYGVCI